ncbi:MAG: alpha/beta fold hydrolase [Nannocystaceae bacterium]
MARLLCFASLVCGLTACAPGDAGPEPTAALHPCTVKGTTRAARCAEIVRPLDPARPEGPQVTLRVALLPASKAARRNPLYFFAGGPGQGAVEAFAPLLSGYDELGRDRDFVLVDQRGTGESAPLRCKPEGEPSLAERLDPTLDPSLLQQCLAGYDVDPRYFTTTIAAEDLDAVRAALGHGRIDLIGGSYGTRAALVYARAHPQHVGRIVIDGVAPVDMALPASFAHDGQAALDGVLSACEADPGCAERFPDQRRRLRAWLDGLARAPATIELPDPRTAAPTRVTVYRDSVAHAIRGLLYAPQLQALLPLTLERAMAGDYGPLVAQAVAFGDSVGDSMAQGMFLSVVCAEDVPFATAKPTEPDTFLGDAFVALLRDACAQWPRAALEPGYRDPIVLEHPTLVLSGALDPVTPPRWGEHVLRGLSAGRHVVVPGAGHGTISDPCVAGLVHAFLDGDDGFDDACVQQSVRPPFVLDLAGPPA